MYRKHNVHTHIFYCIRSLSYVEQKNLPLSINYVTECRSEWLKGRKTFAYNIQTSETLLKKSMFIIC